MNIIILKRIFFIIFFKFFYFTHDQIRVTLEEKFLQRNDENVNMNSSTEDKVCWNSFGRKWCWKRTILISIGVVATSLGFYFYMVNFDDQDQKNLAQRSLFFFIFICGVSLLGVESSHCALTIYQKIKHKEDSFHSLPMVIPLQQTPWMQPSTISSMMTVPASSSVRDPELTLSPPLYIPERSSTPPPSYESVVGRTEVNVLPQTIRTERN